MPEHGVLLCWHAERSGTDVLERAVRALRNRQIEIVRVLYLVQAGRERELPSEVGGAELNVIELQLDDPTKHSAIYDLVRLRVLPLINGQNMQLHINVSPGTPAMHSVWLILHAGGAFPEGTRLWSSQFNQETKRTRIDPVDFAVTTYLSEIHKYSQVEPNLAVYEPDAKAPNRRAAFDRLARYSKVMGAPLLVLGERGTGKTRLVETIVATLKARSKVVTVPCGGLDSTLAESFLFGHRKGAFTGAATDRSGVLKEADGGILFLDEVQDLPPEVQRKLVRVLQDRMRRYRPVGSDREESVDLELVCASNLSVEKLREKLDADLFDRLSHLAVMIPPLRECLEDVQGDWGKVWRECRQGGNVPFDPPWSEEIRTCLEQSQLPGNLRDLQRLAVLVMAWCPDGFTQAGLRSALDEWTRWILSPAQEGLTLGQGTRANRIDWFCSKLAMWAKDQYGTWKAAAEALDCDEKTLRSDVKSK
ncbi:sigma-54 dependent transcriptional regulator [Dechloromonas sp.]|uniref:sigma-54-dependent transcriptional regulator n=1 Tax=Dechloromonas sp. TaxID=1917218 RepID=UPI00217284A5|nr:sigma 54-interacting transcriptional regulator [Dechloromonas sp.]MBU3695593.1 AAA family ATPase [Dechloromonas sp.]